MEQEGGGLQPWQVFTAMFGGFWAISAYFDHFLLTGVFCIAFGVFGEIITKTIYGDNIGNNLEVQKEELKRLLEKVENQKEDNEDDELLEIEESLHHAEKTLPPEPVEEFNPEISEQEEEEEEEEKEIDQEIYEEEEEEDAGPPPLPTRDYEMDVQNQLESINNESKSSGNDNVDGHTINIGSVDDTEEEAIQTINEADIRFDNLNGNTVQVGDILIPQADHYDETIENVEFELTDQSEFVSCDTNANSESKDNTNHEDLREMNGNELSETDINSFESNLNQNVDIKILDGNNKCDDVLANVESEGMKNEMKAIEEDIEHEIISHEAEQEKLNAETTMLVNTEGCDGVVLETPEDNLDQLRVDNTNQEERIITENPELLLPAPPATVESPGNPDIDIDLTDPAVEAAATKIQSAFKGFKIRKKIGKQ